jgi:hypothetical protein
MGTLPKLGRGGRLPGPAGSAIRSNASGRKGCLLLFGDASAGFWSPRHPKRLGDFNDLPAHIDVARRDGCHASWTYRQSRRTTKEIKTVQGKPVIPRKLLKRSVQLWIQSGAGSRATTSREADPRRCRLAHRGV